MNNEVDKEVAHFPINESGSEAQDKLPMDEDGRHEVSTTVDILGEKAVIVKSEPRDEATIGEDAEQEHIESQVDIGTHSTITATVDDGTDDIQQAESPDRISFTEVCNDEVKEDDGNFEFQQTLTNFGGSQSMGLGSLAASMKDSISSMLTDADKKGYANTIQFQEEKTSKVELTNFTLNKKCHNLSIHELRKKLAFCPICQIQYNNHKLANMCLAKHGKRQCWLCLDILSSKKDDFFHHCMEFHSISKTGDIVGCPFCGKYFDFRQGLNQHIVKIHFAESISDIEAVASLSPSTLVDIFTGKPRTSSSSSEDLLPTQEQLRQNDDSEHLLAGPTVDPHTIGENQLTSSSEYSRGSSSLCISMVPSPLLSQVQQQQIRASCNRSASNYSNYGKHFGGHAQNSCNAMIPNYSRPSVITLSCNSVRKMNVPPEQTLSSLSNFVAEYPEQYQGTFQPKENHVEIVENTGTRLQKFMDAGLNYFHEKPPRYEPSSHIRVAPDPEKFDMLSGQADVHGEKYCQIPSPYLEKELSPRSYEQMITRVCSDAFQHQQQPQQNVSPENCLQPILDTEDLTGIGSMLNTTTDLDEAMTQKSIDLQGSTSSNTLESQTDVASTHSTTSDNCQKTGRPTSLNPEIELNCGGSPKFPDNCGVKRRILMKAMWDEHQFKKPAHHPHHTHSLVHDLNAAASLASSPIPQRSQLLRRVTFNKGFGNDGIFHEPQQSQQFQQQLQQPSSLSVQSFKDAGPFFEQYIREDSKSKQGDPLKLLDLARLPRQLEQNLQAQLKNTNINSLTSPSSIAASANNGSVSNQLFSSCARHSSANMTSSSNNVSNAPSTFPLSGTSWDSLSPSPSSAGIQNGGSLNLRPRRPPNTAFWDSLRARLMLSQNVRQIEGGGNNSRRSEFYSPTSLFHCRYSRRESIESIIVQNPFEEEAYYSGQGINGMSCLRSHHKGTHRARGQPRNESEAAQSNSRPFPESNFPNLSQSQGPPSTSSLAVRHHPYQKCSATITNSNPHPGNGEANVKMLPNFEMQSPIIGTDDTRNLLSSSDANLHNYSQSQVLAQQQDALKSLSQPFFFAPRYAEEYHHILNRLHTLDKSRICK